MLKIVYTTRFKKDLKKAINKGCDIKDLEYVLNLLVYEKTLPIKYRDHKLVDSKYYKDVRECHINPDWIMIYKINKEKLLLNLLRNGSHSDIFK